MIWIICMIITVLLITTGVMLYFNKRSGSLRVLFVLLFLFTATFVVYTPAFLTSYDLLHGMLGNFVHVLQVITIDADFMQFYDVIKSEIFNDVLFDFYMILLGILHVLMPATAALSAVTLLFRCFSTVQLYFANKNKKPLYIFSEINERSWLLAKSLKESKCDVIFANSTEDSLTSEKGGKLGFVFREENITEMKIKSRKNKDVYFFCLTENEDESLADFLQLVEKFRILPEETQRSIHIYHFSKSEDYSLFIDSAEKGLLDIQCVNENEMLIYNLLNKYPLFKYADSDIHVLLHGISSINLTALKAIAWCGQICGYSLKISVVGVDIQKAIDKIRLSVPGFFSERYNVSFYNCSSEKELIEKISENCSDANYIIVSEETDNDTMSKGVLLRRLFYRLDKNFRNCPPIFCYIKNPSKFSIVENLATAESNPVRKMSYDLTAFGSLSEVYTYRNLIDSDLEKLAKNVHLAYEEIFSDGEINTEEALSRYNVFQVNKRSNRANALHIRYKLNFLGLDYTEESKEAVRMSDFYTEETIDNLSVSEHDRWMAFLESEGWIPSEKEEVYAYRESGISKGRHNCPILKMHPYICEFEKLKDLSFDLEGKDTTVYDRELILKIPDILGDKWNVSGKKYQIIKTD